MREEMRGWGCVTVTAMQPLRAVIKTYKSNDVLVRLYMRSLVSITPVFAGRSCLCVVCLTICSWLDC